MGDLAALVAAALRDPSVALAYRPSPGAAWTDPDGHALTVDESDPRVTVARAADGAAAAVITDVHSEDRARAARVWLEHAQLRDELHVRVAEEAALRRVATLVAQHAAPEDVLAVVAEEVALHLRADAAMVTRFTAHGVATVLADWARPGLAPFPVGEAIELGDGTALHRVQTTSAPARVDAYAGLEGAHPEEMLKLGMRAGVAAPILVEGRLWGAVAAGSAQAPFDALSEHRLAAFAELVAQAIANVDAQIRLKRSSARVIEAADGARRKLERDLHDGAQQRLVTLAIGLRLLARRAGPEVAPAVEGCIEELLAALEELRDLARGLHPAVLSEHGLHAALEALAGRTPVATRVQVTLPERLPETHEIALYFVATEALANVVKYAQAETVEIVTDHVDGRVRIRIRDDGRGGADSAAGSGLRGLADRVEALDGTLAVESPPGHGTRITAELPWRRDQLTSTLKLRLVVRPVSSVTVSSPS